MPTFSVAAETASIPPAQTILDLQACDHPGCTCERSRKQGHGNTHCPIPTHEDRNPSFTVRQDGDRTLVNCKRGCPQEDVIARLKEMVAKPTSPSPTGFGEPIARYGYSNTEGRLLYVKERNKNKKFRQWQPDGANGRRYNLAGVTRVLYRLPELSAANPGDNVYLTEGEKAADRLAEMGLHATTAGGAANWRPEFAQSLRDLNVFILHDNDAAGIKYATSAAESLLGIARSVKVVQLPGLEPSADPWDWVEHGGTREELEQICEQAPDYISEIAQQRTVSALVFRTARDLLETTPEKPEWIVEGLLALGAISELDASIKSGKSTFVMLLIEAMLCGIDFIGRRTTKTAIVYLTEERSPTFSALLRRCHVDTPDLHVLNLYDAKSLEWPEIALEVERFARSVDARLIVVDTLSRWARIPSDEENNAGAAATAMAPLEDLAARGFAVLILRHDRKGGGQLGESARGSSSFGGAADIIAHLTPATTEGHTTRRKLEGVGRFEEVPDSIFIELQDWRYVVLGNTADVERSDAKAKLLDVLPGPEGNHLTEAQILETVHGLNRSTWMRVRDALLSDGALEQSKGFGETRRAFGYRLTGKRTVHLTHDPEQLDFNAESDQVSERHLANVVLQDPLVEASRTANTTVQGPTLTEQLYSDRHNSTDTRDTEYCPDCGHETRTDNVVEGGHEIAACAACGLARTQPPEREGTL
jgi:AAA domain